MSIETIVRVIGEEAEAEAARILAEAEAQTAAMVADAEATARRQVDEALARAHPALEADHARTVNAARLQLLERRTELVAAQTEAVFATAAAALRAIAASDPERWRDALGRLAEEATGLVGPGATIEVPASFSAGIALLVAPAGARVVCVADAGALAGIRARSEDGRIEIDATLDARLARARLRLAELVAAALGQAD